MPIRSNQRLVKLKCNFQETKKEKKPKKQKPETAIAHQQAVRYEYSFLNCTRKKGKFSIPISLSTEKARLTRRQKHGDYWTPLIPPKKTLDYSINSSLTASLPWTFHLPLLSVEKISQLLPNPSGSPSKSSFLNTQKWNWIASNGFFGGFGSVANEYMLQKGLVRVCQSFHLA